MATQIFRLYDADGNEVLFNQDEATDTGTTQPAVTEMIGQKETAGSYIKQQIRPGLRFSKNYEMHLPETKYIAFKRLITNNANNFFIEYTTVPSVLANDSQAAQTNNFSVALNVGDLKGTVGGPPIIYIFNLTVMSSRLL